MFDGYRVVELSHQLYPGEEEYTYEVRSDYVEAFIPHYRGKRPPDQWYVMSELSMWSHVGTHMEAPYHYQQDGTDIAGIPLKQVVGECVLIDMSGKAIGETITRAELEAKAGDLHEGDILFVFTGYGHLYRTEHSHDRPYFTEEAVRWLAEDVKIACLGVDCSGIEDRNQPRQPNHKKLFEHGIPLIEHLANLDQITTRRFYVVAVPLRLHRCDASPLSVIAFEPEA
jgi:arylformamidase